MKILLTGKPESGKTTLLEKFISAAPNKQGFIAREVREDDERIGFELVSSSGQTTPLARINSDSEIRVSRYGVEVERLNDFLANLPSIEPNNLLYVDEIGQMELFSDKFKELIVTYLDADNPYVGTITSVFRNDFTDAILRRDDIVLLNIEQSNREQIQRALEGLVSNINLVQRLDPDVRRGLTEMARDYASSARFIQLKKLFKNTIKYLVEDRVIQVDDSTYRVRGNTNEHTVTYFEEQWGCDCDLFKGRGSFKGDAGECSHIQATRLFLSV